jgi:hypothetical protein
MKEGKIFAAGKMAVAVFAISAAWLFFGAVAPASAAGTFCTWTASTSQNMSEPTNWERSTDGAACTYENIVAFSGVTLRLNARTSTDAIWDADATTTASVVIEATYTGVISFGATSATTSDFNQAGGTVSTTGSGILYDTGGFTISGGAWTGVSNMNVVLNHPSSNNLITVTALDFAFNDLTVATWSILGSNVTTTNLTINENAFFELYNLDLVVTGNLSNSGGLTQTVDGMVTMAGASATLGGTGTTTPYDLIIAGANVTLVGNVTTTNNVTVNSGKTLALGAYNLAVGGNLVNSGTVTQSAGTVTMSSSTAYLGSTGNTTLYNLTIAGATTTLAGNVTTTNALTINADKEFDAGTFNLLLSGSGIPLVKNGLFTASTSLVTYTGTATIASSTYYNLTIGAGTGTLSANATVSNNLTVNSGATMALAGYDLALTGNLANAGTVTQSAGTVTMSGANAALGSTGNTTLYNLTISGNTTTLFGNVTTTNALTINADKEFDAGTFNLNLSGSGVPLIKTGLFTASTSLVTYTGTATIASSTYYNLTIGAGTGTLSANATVSNNLTVNSGATMALAGYDLALTGNLANAGTVTQSAGTVTMSGANATLGATGGSTSLYNLTIAGATTTLAGNVTTTNVLTINADKELKGGTKSLTLSKASGIPFIITGMFTANTSNVNYTGTGIVSTTAATYYDLAFGTGTYFFSDNTTSTNSFTNSGTTTVWTAKYLYVPGTFDNNGAITETGAIQHPLTSAKITNSAGTETAAFNATSDSVYITVEDSDGNLDANAVDTITGSVVTAASLISDSETITLTETGVDTGIFRSSALPLTVASAATTDNGVFEVSFNGALT